jgi:hypothetical protein
MSMTARYDAGVPPNGAEIRAALERVVTSPGFRAAPRLSSFLGFIVEETLAGQANRIKGYSIAVGALGRSDTFNPQTDPIVRVEASRLRRALDRYYTGPGRHDALVIELPRGRYAPTFRRRKTNRSLHAFILNGGLVILRAARQRFCLAAFVACYWHRRFGGWNEANDEYHPQRIAGRK